MSKGELRSPRHETLRLLVKRMRRRADLTQQQLADLLGWDQKTISNIESGSKRLTVLELVELAEVLKFDAPAAVRQITTVKNS
jgi:transcriptional regulator with XRE-family HTH domain